MSGSTGKYTGTSSEEHNSDAMAKDVVPWGYDSNTSTYTKIEVDTNGILKGGYVSSDNSTTTPLTNGNTYTGTWEDVSAYDSVTVAVKTDQNGVFTIQFSPDGINADSTLTRYYRTSQIEAPHRFTITRRYMRVTFTNNSGSDQTYLRLQTTVGLNKTSLNIPVDATMSQDYDALSVRPTDYKYEVALGRRQGATTWNKFGYNLDFGTSPEVIAAWGGTFTPLTTASTLTIVSSSTDDDGSPAGIGAQTLLIYGIDANRQAQTEAVTMNGTTNVVTSNTWLGVNRVAVTLSGSSQSNVGNITITATTGGSTQAYLPAGESVTQQAIFFTQVDHQALCDWLLLNANKSSGGGSPKITFKAWVYSPTTNTKYQVFRHLVDTAIEDSIELIPSQPFVLNSGDVMWFEGTSSAASTEANVRFSLIESRDVDA